MGKAPDPPDPYATSAAQTQSNEQTAAYNAALNRVNQVTPYGSSTYTVSNPTGSQGSYDPMTGAYTPGSGGTGAPQYTQTITLDPRVQHQLDNQFQQNDSLSNIGFGLADKAGQTLKGTVDPSSLPALSGGPQIGSATGGVRVGGGGPLPGGQMGGTGTPMAKPVLDAGHGFAPQPVGAGAPAAKNGEQATPPAYQSPTIAPPQSGIANAGNVTKSLDYGGAPKLYGAQDFQQSARDTANAVYGQYASRLDPQWKNSNDALSSRLANQGIVQGSEAYQKAMDEQGRNQNDAYAQAQYNSVNAGNEEQSRLFQNSLAARQQGVGEANTQGAFSNAAQQQQFGQNAANAQFANSAQAQLYAQALQSAQQNNAARAQGLTEQTQLQSLPLNQLNALRSGTQINNPNFSPVPQANSANTDVSGNINSAYQSQVANSNNFMNGLFTLGGAAIMASDARLKTDIVPIGTSPVMGLPLYVFRYLGGKVRHVGVMAQDVLGIAPWAVQKQADGYMAVDYGALA